MGLQKGCPCCNDHRNEEEFIKVLDFNAGLVIYLVRAAVTSAQQREKNNNANNMFIIHNTTDRQVLTSNCMSESEDTVYCPRCRYIIKHAKDLLLNVPFINQRDVIGVCDHCRLKARSIVPCNECQKVVGEFIKDKEEKIKLDKQNAKLKKLKEFKSKLKNILIDVEKSNEMKKFESTRRTQSETSLRKQDSTYKKQLTNDYEILETDDIANKIHKYLRKQPVRQIETTPLYTSRAESELSIVGPVRRQRDNERQRSIHFKHSQDNVELVSLPGSSDYISLENKYYIQGNKNIPIKTDLFIKRQFSSERDLSSDAPFREKTTEKIPFEQKIQYKRDHHLSYHDIRDSRHEESDILQKQENEFIKEIPKRSLSDTNIRGYMSEESLRSISTATRNVPRKDFSYFFIKKTDITKKRQMISLSSSELVKNTQDMYRARAEEAKIKKEQELKQKLEGDEKRRIAMEEKRKWQDEEKIKIDKEIKGEKEIPKSSEESLEVKKALDIQEKEEVKEISIKMERVIAPKEAKHKKREDNEGKNDEEKEVHQRKREEKGKEKSLKEEQMRLTKEEKLKLKEEKEREKELKKDQLRLAHEEKQRLKEEKEREKAEKKEQMRLANEEKKRLKEEKEKEKALKKDQSHLANEEKKRLKEEKEKEKALKKDQAHLANEEKQKLKEENEKEKALTKDLLRLANEEKKLFKEGKEKTKSPKKDQTPLDNQEKQKFKEEKEKEKALKKDEMRLASEEKKRLKEEKEKEQAIKKDQMRLENEEKQRLKEEKEKELALKKDLIRLANEEKQKAKESDKLKNRENEEKSSKKDQAMAELMLKIDKESKLRKTQEDEIKKKEAELKFKSLKETKEEEKIQKPAIKKVVEKPQTKELNIDQIKIRRPSPDDLILKLVKLKQSQDSKPKERPTRMSQINLPEKIILSHNKTHKIIKNDNCVICLDSDLDLDIENIMLNEGKSDKSNEIIIGPKIFRYKSPLVLKTEDVANRSLFFTSKPTEDDAALNTNIIGNKIDEEKGRNIPPILAGKYVEQEVPKGITRYALSDRTFIEKGWTMLPTEKVVRKMNVYRMRPAHPEFDWFEHNKNKKLICYDTGEKLAEFDDNGKGRWFYRNGKVALDYYDAEELNAQQRIVIFSSGEPDEGGRPRPLTILATFDYLGNGIVFDHSGKIRLKYNQTEGVVLDRSIGPVSHWKWHTLNDPPVLQQVMIDTQMSHKDPQILKLGGPQENKQRPDNEEMLAIEFDNFIKEKSKKLSQKFKPFQIKMKALKINENFSLKVLDQATIYLIYRDGSTNLKLNIGMILDHQEIVDTDTAEVGEVSNSLERFPARTDSLAGLQRSVAHAQRVERSLVEREKRIRPTQPTASVDRLTSGLSRPLRTQLHAVASTSDNRFCTCRKPSTTNLYYDTRLN